MDLDQFLNDFNTPVVEDKILLLQRISMIEIKELYIKQIYFLLIKDLIIDNIYLKQFILKFLLKYQKIINEEMLMVVNILIRDLINNENVILQQLILRFLNQIENQLFLQHFNNTFAQLIFKEEYQYLQQISLNLMNQNMKLILFNIKKQEIFELLLNKQQNQNYYNFLKLFFSLLDQDQQQIILKKLFQTETQFFQILQFVQENNLHFQFVQNLIMNNWFLINFFDYIQQSQKSNYIWNLIFTLNFLDNCVQNSENEFVISLINVQLNQIINQLVNNIYILSFEHIQIIYQACLNNKKIQIEQKKLYLNFNDNIYKQKIQLKLLLQFINQKDDVFYLYIQQQPIFLDNTFSKYWLLAYFKYTINFYSEKDKIKTGFKMIYKIIKKKDQKFVNNLIAILYNQFQYDENILIQFHQKTVLMILQNFDLKNQQSKQNIAKLISVIQNKINDFQFEQQVLILNQLLYIINNNSSEQQLNNQIINLNNQLIQKINEFVLLQNQQLQNYKIDLNSQQSQNINEQNINNKPIDLYKEINELRIL